ncbi:alpha/beta hydrolase [Nocardia australiensis]|uniref:alpha/beta hydrolase n=1 Tax=Nocardia australiensis TaxID=2887191 RepID=UPI001D1535C3|nr:alpha/beta hydrolase [Nocardia australiensis]
MTSTPATAISKTFVSSESPGAPRMGAGGRPCQGIYYTPADSRPRVAVIATHYQIDFSEHYLADYLAARGIGFLGWNTRYRGYEWQFNLDRALVDIGVGMRWLREQAGVEHIVVLGNSGGGSLMAAYHAQTVEPCVPPARDMQPAPGIDDLIAGDAYISLAAHLGRPDVLTAWMDPAVIDENDPTLTDPELDLFNPLHGPPFSAEFLARYRAAQVTRNHRITVWARAELDRITAAGYHDRNFTVPRTWADPRMVDPALDPSSRTAGMCYRGEAAAANRGDGALASQTTLRNWLHMWSLEDSPCRAEPYLAKITVPTLVMNPEGDEGVFPSDAQQIFDAIPSADKSRVDLPGDHYFRSESAREAVADVIADWVSARFPVQ